jgi:tetratricopeptide (TPR) repeat protein
MKKFFYTLLIGLSLFGQSKGQSELFEQANAAYDAAEYDKAIDLYDSIVQQGFENVATYYNLGNAYYKKGELGASILYYEKAAQLSPRDVDIQNNLKVARKSVIDKFEVVPQPLVKTAYLGLVRWFQPDTWGWISLFFFVVLVLGCYFYLFTSMRKAGFSIALVGLIIGLASLSLAYAHTSYLEKNVPAIIMATSSYVKSAPSEGAEDAFILHEGTKAILLDELDDWSKIKLIDGKIGWIPSEDLRKI